MEMCVCELGWINCNLSSKALLQEPCEFGVSVGDVAVVVNQGCDHATKRKEALVDATRLPGSLVLGACKNKLKF